MIPVANHLWQSTAFAAGVLLLTLVLRGNRAQIRYWLWFAASIKFLIPFSLLIAAGSRVEWRTAPALPATLPVTVEPFASKDVPVMRPSLPLRTLPIVPVAAGVWLIGAVGVMAVWVSRWRRVQAIANDASPIALQAPIRALASSAAVEPGVFGLFRPVLLLPKGVTESLSAEQLQAVIAHELCHVRRRDNLASVLHMLVEAIFWFHPLVWWIGGRLVDERERACDEEVVQLGNKPYVYAEGILNVCKHYFRTELQCVSGVTGADLKKRIASILSNSATRQLTLGRKVLLGSAAASAIALPVFIGIAKAPRLHAQTTAGEPLRFEVASIRPASPGAVNVQLGPGPGGGFRATNISVRQLITFAYDIQDFQIEGSPSWLASQRYDILAKPERAEGAADPRKMSGAEQLSFINQLRRRVQSLLADRFQLAIHRDTKDLPILALVPAKNGTKLRAAADGETRKQHMRMSRGQIAAEGCTMPMLANALSEIVGRQVNDQTGLQGNYNFEFSWTPESGSVPPGEEGSTSPGENGGPAIQTSLQEQLGLRLEARRGPVPIIVIERVERASEN